MTIRIPSSEVTSRRFERRDASSEIRQRFGFPLGEVLRASLHCWNLRELNGGANHFRRVIGIRCVAFRRVQPETSIVVAEADGGMIVQVRSVDEDDGLDIIDGSDLGS